MSPAKNMEHNSKLGRKGLLQVILASVALILILKTFVIDLRFIKSRSMEPTVLSGDYVIISKVAYFLGMPSSIDYLNTNINNPWRLQYREIGRDEILVVEEPYSEGDSGCPNALIKRAVGVPGDIIKLDAGNLYINDSLVATNINQVDSTYIVYRLPSKGEKLNHEIISGNVLNMLIKADGGSIHKLGSNDFYEFQNDFYFFLGDNKDNSRDSRDFGPLPENMIIGKPLFVYWSKNIGDKQIRYDRIFKWIK